MKAHLARDTRALERALAIVEAEVVDSKQRFEAEQRAMESLKSERNAMPVPVYKLPIKMVRKFETLKVEGEHAEYIYDKACETRNALRALIQAGKVEV